MLIPMPPPYHVFGYFGPVGYFRLRFIYFGTFVVNSSAVLGFGESSGVKALGCHNWLRSLAIMWESVLSCMLVQRDGQIDR